MYVPNIGAPKYIKQICTDQKEKIDNNTIIVWDFSIPLLTMDRYPDRKLEEMLDFTLTIH